MKIIIITLLTIIPKKIEIKKNVMLIEEKTKEIDKMMKQMKNSKKSWSLWVIS